MLSDFGQNCGTIAVGEITSGSAPSALVASIHYAGGTTTITGMGDLAKYFYGVQPVVLYAHGLESVLRKLMRRWDVPIDWESPHLIVSGRVVRVQLKAWRVELRDSAALVPGDLDSLAESFDVDAHGEGEYRRWGNWLVKRLTWESEALFTVLDRVCAMTELSTVDFLRTSTVAGLSMKMFDVLEEGHAARYLSARTMGPALDKKLRQAYLGGRCEVFAREVRDGYHYDANSLYPSVMRDEPMPIDPPVRVDDGQAVFNDYCTNRQGFGIAQALVWCPFDLDPPLLGIRGDDGKLIYPVGMFRGHWTFVELAKAVSLGYVVTIEEAYVSSRGQRIFSRFVRTWERVKLESQGPRREFAKLILNGLAGKFGQQRAYIDYRAYDGNAPEYDNAKASGAFVADTVVLGSRLLVTERRSFGYYLRVDIAAHIVSLARIRLYEAMVTIQARGGQVVYVDTDSIVSTCKLPPDMVDSKAFGSWKLERKVKHGIYLAPKFYAEVTGEAVRTIKARGVTDAYRARMTFSHYVAWLADIRAGKTEILLYRAGDGYVAYPRLLTALKRGLDLGAVNQLAFTLKVSNDKRHFDAQGTTSTPRSLAVQD